MKTIGEASYEYKTSWGSNDNEESCLEKGFEDGVFFVRRH